MIELWLVENLDVFLYLLVSAIVILALWIFALHGRIDDLRGRLGFDEKRWKDHEESVQRTLDAFRACDDTAVEELREEVRESWPLMKRQALREIGIEQSAQWIKERRES